MIWFNIKKLENKIAANDISEKESFSYYFISVIAMGIVGLLNLLIRKYNNKIIEEGDLELIIKSMINLFINVCALLIVFRLNNKLDNKDFFKRIIPMSFVVFIRVMVYGTCLAVIAGIAFGILIHFSILSKEAIHNHLALFIFGIGLRIVIYGMIILSYKRIIKIRELL
jgi:hypothetical protein